MRLLLLLVLLSVCRVCHADRDIVYSARYYTPPGSHRTSHFHIYRINPDGTGRMQLTFGTAEDEQPQWSADGRNVVFCRFVIGYPLKPILLCEIEANGGHLHLLRVLKDNDSTWPPDRPLKYDLDEIDPDSEKGPYKVALVNSQTGHRLIISVTKDWNEDPIGDLLPTPGTFLVYAATYHNTAIKPDRLFYQLDPKTGTLRRLTDGVAVIWSPDGSRFCLVPSPNLIPYEKREHPYEVFKGSTAWERIEDRYLIVESKPLYIRAASGGKMRQLTPILSDVDGADWRKEK